MLAVMLVSSVFNLGHSCLLNCSCFWSTQFDTNTVSVATPGVPQVSMHERAQHAAADTAHALLRLWLQVQGCMGASGCVQPATIGRCCDWQQLLKGAMLAAAQSVPVPVLGQQQLRWMGSCSIDGN
jgi:hypothetical protein